MDIDALMGGGYEYQPFDPGYQQYGDSGESEAEIMSMLDPNYEDPLAGAFGGGSQEDWINTLLNGGGYNILDDDPLTGSGHGLGDYNFDDSGNFTGVDSPYDYSQYITGMESEDGSGGSILDQILGSLGGIGKNALGNLTSQGGLQNLLGAGLGMYFDRQNAKDQTANMNQLMQAQDPWVNEYKKFIPQMQEAYTNREQNPMYQMRNQAATRLMELAQNPQAAAPKWR